MSSKATFFIKSMGCKSNQFEGDLIVKNLESAGYVRTFDVSEAEYYILNSCSVTHKSDSETLYLLRNTKNKYPNIITVLTGCVAQIEKEELLKMIILIMFLGMMINLRLQVFFLKKLQKFLILCV